MPKCAVQVMRWRDTRAHTPSMSTHFVCFNLQVITSDWGLFCITKAMKRVASLCHLLSLCMAVLLLYYILLLVNIFSYSYYVCFHFFLPTAHRLHHLPIYPPYYIPIYPPYCIPIYHLTIYPQPFPYLFAYHCATITVMSIWVDVWCCV